MKAKPYQKRTKGQRRAPAQPPAPTPPPGRQKMSTGDKLSAIGIIIAVVSAGLAQWNQVGSGRDMARALGDMSKIAQSMSDQAKAVNDQRPLLQRQADAAADSAAAAKTTANLAKGQAAAIVRQADALIGGAQATTKAAEAQLASAEANNRTAQAGAKAAEQQEKAAALLSVGQRPIVRLAAVRINGLSSPPNKDGRITFTVRPSFINDGGSVLYPTLSLINILFTNSVPTTPPKDAITIRIGGNQVSIAPHLSYATIEPYEMWTVPAQRDRLKEGKDIIFVWGRAEFNDAQGGHHQSCFSYVVAMKNLDSGTALLEPAGGPAYYCPET